MDQLDTISISIVVLALLIVTVTLILQKDIRKLQGQLVQLQAQAPQSSHTQGQKDRQTDSSHSKSEPNPFSA